MIKDTDELGTRTLSIAVIGPEPHRRQALATKIAAQHGYIVKQLEDYPDIDDLPRFLQGGFDVLLVDLDSSPELALDLVENVCGQSTATLMVYSAQSDPDVLVRCMRAGAREFLVEPFADQSITEALVRATVRRTSPVARKAEGKLFVFIGAKGGSGVTTVATNFAVSLAVESAKKTLLVDLNLPLGDAALGLGIMPQYSVADALQNASRLDFNFLETLLAKHSSGLWVLAAPDRYAPVQIAPEAVERLLEVVRQNFDYVVVDAGSTFSQCGSALLTDGSLFLITQVGISELRNANRLVSTLKSSGNMEVTVVLNRFSTKSASIDDASIEKALTTSVQWKIPSDFKAVQEAQHTATPLTGKDSVVARTIRQMSRAAAGLPAVKDKKRLLNLFG